MKQNFKYKITKANFLIVLHGLYLTGIMSSYLSENYKF